MATGDNASNLRCWGACVSGKARCVVEWKDAHAGESVEDVAWSPTEASVLMSCGGDAAVKVWDARHGGGAMLSVQGAHEGDVNSLSWNGAVSYLVASAGDDGVVKVWDLRAFGDGKAVGKFAWHAPAHITSVQWDPHDESS